MQDLDENNIKAKADMNIKRIAEQNNVSPVDVYEIVKKNAYQHQ